MDKIEEEVKKIVFIVEQGYPNIILRDNNKKFGF